MKNATDSFGTYYSFNESDKKNPIVFIHGLGLIGEMWEPQINFFKKYSTLTYDLIGHGKTPMNKSTLHLDDFCKQLSNLIGELNFSKIHLVGFSLGALIARHFAAKHNKKLCSLILYGSIYKRTEEQKKIVLDRFKKIKTKKPDSEEATLLRWFTNDFISKNPKICKKISLILKKNNQESFLKAYELFANYEDDDSMFKRINAKTLIVTGENDVGSTPEMNKNLSQQIRESKFTEIKKGKHLCSIECKNDVNITFKEFIDQQNG
jgi:pimeloyl-ACP methyl ester carboxylesterase